MAQQIDSNEEEKEKGKENHYQVIILGSGPAGLTAAIYASRANLGPLLLEGDQAGGQLVTTTDVENFPGFVNGIGGFDLVDSMRKQAERFGTIIKMQNVEEVDLEQRPFVIETKNSKYTTDSLIIATGATAKYLGLKKEQELIGHGVSACATCDGFFFKEKEIAVVGGGDTAMEEATFLTKFAKKVTVIHRRDSLRASKIMQDRAFNNKKIEFLWDTIVTDIIGNTNNGIKSLKIKNLKTNKESVFPVEGLFLAIGHEPNTKPFKEQLKLDNDGYIIVKPGTVSTNIDGVFACGDVQDRRYKQAITAAGTGCMAAMDAEKFLESSTQHI